MLEINPETVYAIAGKARQFHVKEQVVIPDDPANPADDDWAMQVLADHADDLTFQEARELIVDLEPDQQVQIVALMWLGRGDYEVEEWEQALDDAKDVWHQNTAEYLFAHPYLSDHLTEGLDMLGYSSDE